MVSVLRPGQRVLNIPAIGVQTSRRAVSGGNGLLNNLVAYWPLNEAAGANNALDLHTNGLTLTQVSSPGADTGKVYATARTFDGGNDYFTRSTDDALLSAGDADFTFATWIFRTGTPDFGIILGKREDGRNEYEIIFYKAGGNVAAFSVSANGTEWSTNGIASSEAVTLNEWFLIVAWHDSLNNQLGIQINGNAGSTKPYSSGVYDGSARFALGWTYPASTLYRWPGRIGPVAMWKSAAGGGGVLSSAQRLALYNAGAGLPYASFTV